MFRYKVNLMKSRVLILMMWLLSGISYGATITIINSGFAFSPADVTINAGDTVIFDLMESHNAVEVSETTWLANGNTPLPGFSLPFGGGVVTGLTPGVHFYVCTPHASGGMKGKITVHASTGIASIASFEDYFKLFPNPALNQIFLQNLGSVRDFQGQGQLSSLEISDVHGVRVLEMDQLDLENDQMIDISYLSAGQYFITLRSKDRFLSRKFIKQ